MKIVHVRANPAPGYQTRSRADRFFEAGRPVAIEVLDHEEPWKSYGPGNREIFHPDTSVELEVKNSTTGLPQKVRRPHPTRIGLAEYREILADPHLSTSEGGELGVELSQAALDAARGHASELAGELTMAKAELAASEEQVAKLKAEIAKLTTSPVAKVDATEFPTVTDSPGAKEKARKEK